MPLQGETLANVQSDSFDVAIDASVRDGVPNAGTTAPSHAQVSFDGGYTTTPITQQRTGTTPQGMVVTGHDFSGEIIVQEEHADVLTFFTEIAAAAPKIAVARGKQLPTHSLTLHPAGAPDASGDIFLAAVIFGRVQRTIDGDGLPEYRFPWTAVEGVVADDGVGTTHNGVFRIGANAGVFA